MAIRFVFIILFVSGVVVSGCSKSNDDKAALGKSTTEASAKSTSGAVTSSPAAFGKMKGVSLVDMVRPFVSAAKAKDEKLRAELMEDFKGSTRVFMGEYDEPAYDQEFVLLGGGHFINCKMKSLANMEYATKRLDDDVKNKPYASLRGKFKDAETTVLANGDLSIELFFRDCELVGVK